MFARWRRRKRRRMRQPPFVCADDAFHPYVVDEVAVDKLSCGDQMAENGLQQAPRASNGSMSPRNNPASPKRPLSYRLSTSDGAVIGTSFENAMRRTHDYGSNADGLENSGRQPDASRSPEFVGRSPAVAAKRTQPPASVDSREASKGLNNLNKAENYRKKSKSAVDDCLLMMWQEPLSNSLQALLCSVFLGRVYYLQPESPD